MHAGAAALTNRLLISVGHDGCVCVASLEPNDHLGVEGVGQDSDKPLVGFFLNFLMLVC